MANTQIRTGNGKQTGTKHPCGGYISRKERRERGDYHHNANGRFGFKTVNYSY